MDLDSTLLLMGAIWCGAALVSALRVRPWALATLAVVLGVILVTLALWPAMPSVAARLGFALTVVFVLAPPRLAAHSTLLALRQDYRGAKRWLRVASLLHPSEQLRKSRIVLDALDLAHRGQVTRAIEILDSVPVDSGLFVLARATRFRLLAAWQELIDWVERELGATRAARHPELFPHLLRARGEVGDLSGLVGDFERLIGKHRSALTGLDSRLFVHAFVGHVDCVYALLAGPLRAMPGQTQEFWILTAELAAGHENAREGLLALRADATPQQRPAFEYRLRHPLTDPASLTTSERAIVERDREIIDMNLHYARGLRFAGRRPWATRGLIAVNVLVFCVEALSGGSTDEQNLYRLGAVMADNLTLGEAWRTLAATFLHFGWLHLTLNMFGLLLLGPFVERSIGSFRYLGLYLTSGILSMLGAAYFSAADAVVVGASGSIMAITGAQLVLALRGFRRGAPLAKRHLIGLGAAVVLQTIVDVLTPQISQSAHICGFLAGVGLAFLMLTASSAKEARA